MHGRVCRSRQFVPSAGPAQIRSSIDRAREVLAKARKNYGPALATSPAATCGLDFVAALATTSVTSNSPASAASGSAGTPVSGDAFAAMLDALDQELASDVADPQSATDSDASTAAAATTPGSTASANASALDPMLAQLLAQQAVPGTPGAISPEPDDANKADPEAPGNEVAAAQAAQTSAPLPAPVDPKTIINAAAADPTKVDLETEAAADTRAKTDSSADTLAKADSSTDMSAMADTPSATDPNAPAKRNGALAGVAGRSAEHASSTGQRHRAQAWSALPDDHSHSDIPRPAPRRARRGGPGHPPHPFHERCQRQRHAPRYPRLR